MSRVRKQIEAFLKDQDVDVTPHTPDETRSVEQQWRQTYAAGVKRATGSWIYGGFRWHGFSSKHEKALEGERALQAYLSQWPAPYVVFDEEGTWSLGCASQTYPDFSLLGADIYVSHHNMKWTMAFTHEQPHDGPFFAERRATPGR